MPSLQQPDIELGSTNEGNNKDGATSVLNVGEIPSSNGDEIVAVLEDGVNDVRKKDDRRESNASECSVEILDLESGVCETKLHLSKSERDCRICQLSIDASNDCGLSIELGCSCKDDLAAAHRQCAEAWFKIKGNKICEICGSIAQNVPGVYENVSIEDPWDERNDPSGTAGSSSSSQPQPPVARRFWQGHRFLNFLLACMVFAFVVSWLFHFNVPS